MHPSTQSVEVWGDFACFSRPELKVERFSYPIITPSAARGILDAIYSKPNKNPLEAEFRWQITRIEMLAPVKFIALRRNEVKDVVNVNAVGKWIEGYPPEPLWADMTGSDEKGRTQRQTMALKDVRYRIHATIQPWPGHEHRLSSLEAQFQRRLKQGKCFYQPCFGCREFPAYFSLPVEDKVPIPYTQDIGWMLYDVFDLSCPGTAMDAPAISVFQAKIINGIMKIPPYESQEVHKAGKEVH